MTGGLSICVTSLTSMHGNEILVNNIVYTTTIMQVMFTRVGRVLPSYFDKVPTIASLMVDHIHQIC